MAAAEARAVWQRTANRYFVQEDAKRAPKLACCPTSSPSSSSSLSKQIDTMPPNATDEHESFAPPDCNSCYSNLSPDSKWWLQLQSYDIYQKGLMNEQVNTMEARNSHQFVENFYDEDLKSLDVMGSQSTPKGDNLGEESYEFVEMDSVGCCTGSKEPDEFSLDSKFPHWMGSEKNNELPWWQMTDKDDLASFVAQRSQDFIENCDLPQPLNTSIKRDSCQHEKDKNFTTSESWEPQRVKCQSATIFQSRQNAISGDRSKPIRESGEGDWSKGKVLEALRHSQTRAREADKAAKEAYAEKEDVVKLIFKQASQLFAYKQWLLLLQVENLYYHIKKQPISSPLKTRKKKKKPRIARNEDDEKGGKCGFVLALGLGLVGAGMLLGWTVGWMLLI